MSDNEESSKSVALAHVVREQRRRIEELEAQVDYLTKRFRAAKQAVNWLETRFRLRWQDSYGT